MEMTDTSRTKKEIKKWLNNLKLTPLAKELGMTKGTVLELMEQCGTIPEQFSKESGLGARKLEAYLPLSQRALRL